ncbi:hypothetical protein HPB48_009490 [Haemaphysalis longicornis]|uniref:Uncharacterized protein n=1 Tax=Haemaphysalis longicornis TaxID=44386 RepID=A0A9J6GD70_HAELO|nr:hypothetical protein HPB48_009490 [Haemaphysalis longicornis]
MNNKCTCAAVPKRYLMMTLVIVGIQVILWQTVSYTTYCFKWKDYVPYRQKEPFVYSHLLGLLLSLMPASLVSVNCGANRVFGASLLTLSVLLEVAPLAIHLGIHGLAGAQFLNGAAEVGRFSTTINYFAVHSISQAFVVTSLYGVLADWTPVDERTTVVAIVTSSIAWFVLWYLLFFDDPYHNESVTEEERCRVTEGNGRTSPSSEPGPVPWRQILRSTPVHLVCLCVAAGMAEQRLGKYNFLMYLGGASTFPSLSSVLALAAAVVTCGVASDCLRNKGLVSTTGAARITCVGGLTIHACAIMLQGLKESRWIEHIAMTALGVFFVGIETSHLDMAPRHAPVLKALSATTLGVLLGGISVFAISDTSSLASHRLAHVFIPVAQVVTALLYLLYGRADLQTWDALPELREQNAVCESASPKGCQEEVQTQRPQGNIEENV